MQRFLDRLDEVIDALNPKRGKWGNPKIRQYYGRIKCGDVIAPGWDKIQELAVALSVEPWVLCAPRGWPVPTIAQTVEWKGPEQPSAVNYTGRILPSQKSDAGVKGEKLAGEISKEIVRAGGAAVAKPTSTTGKKDNVDEDTGVGAHPRLSNAEERAQLVIVARELQVLIGATEAILQDLSAVKNRLGLPAGRSKTPRPDDVVPERDHISRAHRGRHAAATSVNKKAGKR